MAPATRGEPPRDRSEKKAVRGMTGDFDGLGMLLWVSRTQARQLLPANPDLRLDYPGEGDRYPIVILLGAEQDVGVQARRRYVHPKFLKHYENAYVIVPYLRPSGSERLLLHFLADLRFRRADRRGRGQAQSFAEGPCRDRRPRRPIRGDLCRHRRIDVAVQEAAAAKPQAVLASTEAKGPATVDFLHAVFKQPKIEFSPGRTYSLAISWPA